MPKNWLKIVSTHLHTSIVLIIFIYPLTMRWNLSGTSIAVLLSILVATFGFSFQVVRIIECEVQAFIKVIALPVFNGLVMVLIILFAKDWFQHTGFIRFFMLIAVGVISYGLIASLFDRFFNYGIIRLIKEKIDSQ